MLHRDIIPVVYGGLPGDYETILPPHSYIDANNVSAQDLALQLRSIMSNRTLYLSYFKWKQYYFTASLSTTDELYCLLCQRMEEQREAEAKDSAKLDHHSLSGEQIKDWYFRNGSCRKPVFVP